MLKRQASIKRRVRAVILLASVMVLSATAAGFVIYEAISFKAQHVRDLSTLAAVIADNSAAPLAFNNPANAEEILSALKAEPDIVAAALYDFEGKVFATYPPTLPISLLPARPENQGHRFTGDALVLFKPVIQEQKAIGTLYLRSSLEGLYQRFRRYSAIVAAVLIGSLGLAFALSSLLQRRISDPILALMTAAGAVVEREDYSVRAPKLTEDELGTLTDAFNRMLSEIQAHQARLTEQARLLDLSFDAIFVRDLQNRITYWNKGAEQAYGFTGGEARGKTPHGLLQTVFPEPLERIDEKLYRDGRWIGELVHTRKDGSKLIDSSRWSLDRDPQGNPVSILETNTDITERKQAEEKLRESREELRQALEFDDAVMTNMAEGLYTVDGQGNVTFMNPASEKLFGWTFVELRGRKMHDMTHHKHRDGTPFPAEECAGLQVLKQGRTLIGREDCFIRKDGAFFDVVYSSSPIKSGDRIVGLVVVFSDVSERRKADEALAQAQAELRQHAVNLENTVAERTAKLQETIAELEAFSYSISHDMRAPLRAMQGYAKALLADYEDRLDSEARHYLDRIARAANRLDSLIQDVLAYSRVAKGEIALHPVDLEHLIADILSNHPEFQPPQARVDVVQPLHRVLGHEAYLTQCVSNLLGNAVKFVPAGVVPEIRIRTERVAGRVRVWFEDNGIGIDPSHHQRIFQIFGQVYPEKKYGGTGIGLAIVRKAAQRMNGEAGVESELDKGSRFWIVLNAEEP